VAEGVVAEGVGRMDSKLLFAVVSIVISTISFVPYIRDILKGKTRPHAYTWLIWIITQGTAAAGIWHGGGGVGTIGFVSGTILVVAVFLMSFKYGTKNITKSDTIILIMALLAILVWWKLNSPVTAVLMVSAIDLLGYIPSYRKTFYEPWSETALTWFGFVVANMFGIAAMQQYNLLTLSYILTITLANGLMVILCLVRRNQLK